MRQNQTKILVRNKPTSDLITEARRGMLEANGRSEAEVGLGIRRDQSMVG